MSVLRLECTKFDFRWGSAPHPAQGAYSALPGPVVVFKGLLLKGGRGKREGKGRETEGEGRGGEGKGWKCNGQFLKCFGLEQPDNTGL